MNVKHYFCRGEGLGETCPVTELLVHPSGGSQSATDDRLESDMKAGREKVGMEKGLEERIEMSPNTRPC